MTGRKDETFAQQTQDFAISSKATGSNKFLSQDNSHGEKQKEKDRGGEGRDGVLIKAMY